MMKFQKINLLLLIGLLSSNVGFSAEGEHFTPLKNANKYSNEDYEKALKNLDLDKDNFTQKNIKERYRQLALMHHPDKGGKESNFKHLNTSYKYASDADHEKSYKNYRDITRELEKARQEREETARAQEAAQKEEAARQEKERKAQDYKIRLENARERARKAAEGETSGAAIPLSTKENVTVFRIPTLDQITKATPSNIEGYSTEQINGISKDPAKLNALLENKNARNALTRKQVQAIDANNLADYLSGKDSFVNNIFEDKTFNNFINKMSFEQSKASYDLYEKDSWGKDIRHRLSKNQRAIIRDLAKNENRGQAVNLAKDLAISGTLTPDEELNLKKYMKSLDTKEKEIVINRYFDTLAEKDKLFSNKNKINSLKKEINNKVFNFINKYKNENDYPIFIKDDSACELVDMSKIDPTKSIQDQFPTLLKDGTISKEIKEESLPTHYAQWFAGRIDLSQPLNKEISDLMPAPDASKGIIFRPSADKLEDFDQTLQKRINSALNKRVNIEFLIHPRRIDADYIKYVNPETLGKLSPDIFKTLSVDQIEALAPDQIIDLSPEVKTIIATRKAGKTAADKGGKEQDPNQIEQQILLNKKPSTIASWRTADAKKVNAETFARMTQDQIDALNFDQIDINTLSTDVIQAIIPRIENDATLRLLLENAKGKALATVTSSANLTALRSLDEEQMESTAKDEDAVKGLAANKVIIDTGLCNNVLTATEKVETTETFVQALPEQSLDSIVRNTGIDSKIILENISEEQAKNLSENAASSVVTFNPKAITESKEIAQKVLPQITDMNIVNRLLKNLTDPKELANIVSSISADQITQLKNDYFTSDKLLQPDVILSLDAEQIDAFMNKLKKQDVDTIKQLLTNSEIRSNSNVKKALESRLSILTNERTNSTRQKEVSTKKAPAKKKVK